MIGILMTYKHSSKQDFIKPTHIKYNSLETHMWCNEITGKIKVWIYVSSKSLHQIIFGFVSNIIFYERL